MGVSDATPGSTGPRPTISRVGAIGDVHAEDDALLAALDFFEDQLVDRVLCVGDIADGPGDLRRCCSLLQERSVDVVRGNHDRWILEGTMRDLPQVSPAPDADTRVYLEALPRTLRFETDRGPLLLCHGLGDDDMSGVGPDDFGYALEANTALQRLIGSGEYRFVVNGHTHKPMVRSFGATTIINVGTLCRDHQPSIAIIDFDAQQVAFHQLDGPTLTDQVTTHSMP